MRRLKYIAILTMAYLTGCSIEPVQLLTPSDELIVLTGTGEEGNDGGEDSEMGFKLYALPLELDSPDGKESWASLYINGVDATLNLTSNKISFTNPIYWPLGAAVNLWFIGITKENAEGIFTAEEADSNGDISLTSGSASEASNILLSDNFISNRESNNREGDEEESEGGEDESNGDSLSFKRLMTKVAINIAGNSDITAKYKVTASFTAGASAADYNIISKSIKPSGGTVYKFDYTGILNKDSIAVYYVIPESLSESTLPELTLNKISIYADESSDTPLITYDNLSLSGSGTPTLVAGKSINITITLSGSASLSSLGVTLLGWNEEIENIGEITLNKEGAGDDDNKSQ